jgi:hypothetical protein
MGEAGQFDRPFYLESTMKMDVQQLEDLCRRHGAAITAAPFDGPTLMWAVATVESSEGQNFAPRHEAGYCRGGHYFDKHATEQWNCLAHMSYTPWQVMWPNCAGASPLILLQDPETMAHVAALCIQEKASHVNVRDINAALAVFAHFYNGPKVAAEYIADLTAAYTKGLPA